MGISGNLKTMALAELLQWLCQGQKTGTLVIEGAGQVEKRVFFDKGVIISSASTDPKEYLGHFLVARGYATEEEVNAAVARQTDEKVLLGKLLVEMGTIPEEDLQQLLQHKAEETIYDIFTWEEGEFRFLDQELPEETMVPMKMDVQWVVLEGSRRLDEWGRIRQHVPSSEAIAVSVAALEELEVDEVERRILDFIDDQRTVEEISAAAQATLFQVTQILAAHVEVGNVKVVKPRIVEVEVPVVREVPAAAAAPRAVHAYATAGSVPVAGKTLHFAAPATPAASAAPASPAADLVEQAESKIRGGELADALESLRQAKEAAGYDDRVAASAKQVEGRLDEALERAGVRLASVPKLRCGIDKLGQLDISPQEGFMLTRVDGSYDLKSILKLSPMPKLDAKVLLWRLSKAGHVTL